MNLRVLSAAVTTALVAGALSVIPAAGANAASHAAEDFESFSTGSAAGQSGWRQSNSAFDNSIADVTGLFGGALGTRALRVSNAVTSGSFGDQLFSPTLAQEAGETSAENNGLSTGPRQSRFTNSFTFASASSAYQPGLALGISPDRGDGARMSLVRMYDEPTGLKVTVRGVDASQDPDDDSFFTETTVASNLDRAATHTLSMTLDFVDGSDDDTVSVSVDGGASVHTTSWEEYYRLGEMNPTRTVGTVLFRDSIAPAPGEVAGLTGKGVYFDDFTTATGPSPAVTTSTEVVTPADLGSGGWQVHDQATATSQIIDGPGNPTLGSGAMNVATGSGNGPGAGNGGKSVVANGTYAGSAVSGLTDLQYDFYRSSTSTSPASNVVRTAINLGVDFDNGGTPAWTNLVYEPVYDTTISLTDDTWQHADAFAPTARWWSTRALPGVCGPGTAHPSCPDTFVPWSTILSALNTLGGGTLDPAGVQLATGQNSTGGPWSNFVGAFDNVTIGTTTAVTTSDFEYGLGTCEVAVDAATKTFTLLADCETDRTIRVRGGWTVDGDGHKITATETPSTTFHGAVLQNDGTSMHVRNLTVTTSGWESAGKNSGGDLAGVRFKNASGSVSGVTISGISHGNGVQEGNALDLENYNGGTRRTVTMDDVAITNYQKTGIRINGNVRATVTDSTIGAAGTPSTGAPLDTVTAANSLQVSRGADAVVRGNVITGNDWDTNEDWNATAVLFYQSGNVTFEHNVVDGPGVDFGVVSEEATGSVVVRCNLVGRTADNPGGLDVWSTGIGSYDDASFSAVDNTIEGYDTSTDGTTNVVNQGACAPSTPSITVSGITSSSSDVSWVGGAAKSYAPVDGWELSGPGGIVTLPAGTTSYHLTDLRADRDYSVSVRALNVSGHSSWANTTFDTPTPAPPVVRKSTLAVTPGAVTYGSSATVSGRLTANGVGAGGVAVTLWRSAGSSFTQITTVTTRADGTWSTSYKPNASGSFKATATGYPNATGKLTVGLKVKAKAKAAKVIAKVKPAGKKVVLQKKVNGTWKKVTKSVLATGQKKVTFEDLAKGKYRIVAKSNLGYAQATSATVKVIR